MSTGIQWTNDVWNPTTGCTRVSAGCEHCYAFDLHDKRYKANRDVGQWVMDSRDEPVRRNGLTVAQQARELDSYALPLPAQYDVPFSRVQLMPDRLEMPLHWKKPRKVFVNSMSDLFHEDVPDEFIDRVFAVMALTPQHTYQVLTKRPERMRAYLTAGTGRQAVLGGGSVPLEPGCFKTAYDRVFHQMAGSPRGREWRRDNPAGDFLGMNGLLPQWPLPNVWLGTSVEDQVAADERIPHLLATPAAVRFLSCEPILSMVDLSRFLSCEADCEGCRREVLGSDGAGHVLGRSGRASLEARASVERQPAGSPADYLAGRADPSGEGQRRGASATSVHGASRENAGLRSPNRLDGTESRGHPEPDGSEPYRWRREEQPSLEPRSDYQERERQARAAHAWEAGESEHAGGEADSATSDRDPEAVRQPVSRSDGDRQDVRGVGRDDSEHRTPREVGAHSRLISWVIVGGESGPHARPCNVEWIRSIVGQCQADDVPVFVKQLGSRVLFHRDELSSIPEMGIRSCLPYGEVGAYFGDPRFEIRLRSSHGSDPEEWPEDLRIRDFPNRTGEVVR